jgi:hypothetical protein
VLVLIVVVGRGPHATADAVLRDVEASLPFSQFEAETLGSLGRGRPVAQACGNALASAEQTRGKPASQGNQPTPL